MSHVHSIPFDNGRIFFSTELAVNLM